MIFSQIFLIWNEIAAKTENEILLEIILKIGMNLRLRQKMIMSLNNFVEFGWICGYDRKWNSLGKVSQNWNEFVAKTEKDIVFE